MYDVFKGSFVKKVDDDSGKKSTLVGPTFTSRKKKEK